MVPELKVSTYIPSTYIAQIDVYFVVTKNLEKARPKTLLVSCYPCPFVSVLRKFALDFVVVIFFKNAEKIASGGLIK